MGAVVTTNYAGSYRSQGPTTTTTTDLAVEEISLFPNPTQDRLNISIINPDKYIMSIYAIDGKPIPYTVESIASNSCTIRLQTGKTESQSYIAHLVHKTSGATFSKQFIVNP